MGALIFGRYANLVLLLAIKVRFGEGAETSTPGTCAPQKFSAETADATAERAKGGSTSPEDDA